MTQRKASEGLDFEALQRSIERCDPDLLLCFYADDARLSIVNAQAQQSSPFELRGKAEIARHLRATYGQEATHRVERKFVGEERVTFREACEYPDGGRVWVETTLEAHHGKIISQVDVVASDARADRQEESGRGPPTRSMSTGVDATLPDRLLCPKQATEKEDY